PFTLSKKDDMNPIGQTLSSCAENCSNPPPLIDVLPDELLVRIFACLSFADVTSCRAVCSKWYRVTSDSVVWMREAGVDLWKESIADVETSLEYSDLPRNPSLPSEIQKM